MSESAGSLPAAARGARLRPRSGPRSALLPRHARLPAGLRRQLYSGERWVAVAPPDGTAVLSLVASETEVARAQADRSCHQVVFVTEDVPREVPRVAQTRRHVRPRAAPAAHQVPAAALGQSSEPRVQDRAGAGLGAVFARFQDVDGNSLRARQLRRGVARRRGAARAAAAKLEAERRAASRARDRPAGPGPPSSRRARRPRARCTTPAAASQAREVGGDYYDFLSLGQERLELVVGDIAGKGIAAALLMANLQANLRSQCAHARSISRRSSCAR